MLLLAPSKGATVGTISAQTSEWWRHAAVRLSNFAGWLEAGDDRQMQSFVDEWSPDVLDWYTDYRWQVGEWGRSRGIAVAHNSEYEYEEAPVVGRLNESNVDNTTWGDNGMAVDIHGRVVYLGQRILVMTHGAPKWHLSAQQGIARPAAVADAVTQDNAIGTICVPTHGGYSEWEMRRFAASPLGQQLHLPSNFSVRQHVLRLRAAGMQGETLIVEPIVQNYILWQYQMWRDAWRDASEVAHRRDGALVSRLEIQLYGAPTEDHA